MKKRSYRKMIAKKKVTVNEATTLKALVDKNKAPEEGLWLGGSKYRVTKTEPLEDIENVPAGTTIQWYFAAKPKGGVHIVKTVSQIIVGFYDEEKGQSSGNCKKAVVAYAEYLVGLGY